MTELLMKVGSMSLTAALAALAVIALRWVLVRLKAPAFVRLLLWAVVLFRMVCPVSFTSPWSAAALAEEALPHAAEVQTTKELAQRPGTGNVPVLSPNEPLPGDAAEEITVLDPAEIPQPRISLMLPLALLWLAGVAFLWGWWLYHHLKLKRRMETAVRTAPGVFESDQPGPPFVLGFLPPNIYLPQNLPEPDRSYVLAHEKLHLRRGDFLWKPLFFLAAAVHWFNPVLWLAWRLFCRDLEASCDEGVLRELPEQGRTGYAKALLTLAAPETSRLPAAFGEHDVSRRVKGALAYRKPAVIAAAVLVIAAVGVGLWLAADSSGGAGLPQSPPAITLSFDSREAQLTAADWDGETPPDPAELLTEAPLFTDDYLWFHGADMRFGDQPRPEEGVYTDYLLRDGQWVEGPGGSMTYTISLHPREDSDGTGTEERGVVFTCTWKEGFHTRSATYAFRLLVPSVREGQVLEEPMMISAGTILPTYEGGASEFGAIIGQGNLRTLPMDAVLTIHDVSTPFQTTEITLCLLDGDGTVLDQAVVGGSSSDKETEHVRSAFGFPLNLENKGWWNGKDMLLGVTVTYIWQDGSQTQYSTAFWAVPQKGIDLLSTLPAEAEGGEAVLLWQEGTLALAGVSRPESASVYRTEDGGLNWEDLYYLPQPPYRDTVWDTRSVRAEGDALVMERVNRDTGENLLLYSDRIYAVNWTARVELDDLSAVNPADLPDDSVNDWMDSWDLDPVVKLWPDSSQGEDTTGVSVYVCSETVTGRSDLAVLADGILSWFDPGTVLYGQKAWARPAWADLDGDGTEELILTHYAGSGTGVILEALHVLEPQGDGHYAPAVSFSLETGEGRAQGAAALAEIGLDRLSCGEVCTFPDPFTVELGVYDPENSEMPFGYVGTLTCTLAYDGESLTLTDPVYVPSV